MPVPTWVGPVPVGCGGSILAAGNLHEPRQRATGITQVRPFATRGGARTAPSRLAANPMIVSVLRGSATRGARLEGIYIEVLNGTATGP